mgnify:FL=1
MAWDFGAQINSFTGFDGNDTSASEEGETFDVLATRWLTDAAKEIINILPPKLKEKCIAETSLNSATPMDLDGVGEVMYVTRLSADSGGFRIPCREVPSAFGELTADSSSIYFASNTDPAYWVASSSDAMVLNVNPTPTSNQTAIVYHVAYPTVDHAATTIVNFPDEAEFLVPLRASINAIQYKLNFEEDIELYVPMLSALKVQYQEGVQGLISKNITVPKQGSK